MSQLYVFFMCFNHMYPWAGLRLPESDEMICNVKIDSDPGVFLSSERAVKVPVVADICMGLSQLSLFCSFWLLHGALLMHAKHVFLHKHN